MAEDIAKVGLSFTAEGVEDFSKALKNVSATTKELRADLRSAQAGYDKNTSSVQKLADKQKYAQGMTDAYKEKVRILSQQLREMESNEKTSADALTRKRTELKNAEASLKRYQKQLEECNTKIKTHSEQLREWGTQLKKVGENMTKAGKTLTIGVTAPLTAVGAAGVKNFAEVDKTMALANKTMGNTAEEAGHVSDAMKNAAANSIYGMEDAANATLNFARAGLDAEESANALAPAMNLAAGEGGDLNTVSAGLVATINGFHDSFDNAATYADVFASACNNSALDVDSLSDAMSVAAPIFSAAGYSVNDAALYMGVMANNGIDANKAANSLKTGLSRLVSPAKAGAEMMKKLGIEVTNSDGTMKSSVQIQAELHDAFSKLSESEQLTAAAAIFGKEQMASWLALVNAAPSDVEDLSDSLDGCKGTTEDMAKTMQEGFGGSIEKLKSNLDVLTYNIGESLAPYIQMGIDKVQGLVEAFNGLDSGTKDLIAKIGMTAAAIGPILVIGGKLMTGAGNILTSVEKISSALGTLTGLLGPAGTAFLGIGSAAAAFVGVAVAHDMAETAKYAGTLRDSLNSLNDEYSNAASAADDSLSKGLADLAKYKAYEKTILDLNDVEHKSTVQKMQMKDAVDGLNEVIPGLADSFDEETGSLSKTNDELETMFDNNEKLMIQEVVSSARKEALEAYNKALLQAQIATDSYADAEAGLKQYLVENGYFTEQQIEKIEAAQEAQKNGNEVYGESATLLAQYNTLISTNAVPEWTKKIKVADEAIDQANENVDESKQRLDEVDEAGKKLSATLDDNEGSVKKGTDAFIRFKDAQVAGKTALDDTTTSAYSTSDAISEVGDTTDEAAQQAEEAAQKAAEIQKSALESVTSAFEATYDSIAGKSEINMFEKFAPKNDVTVEDMISNMKSQNEASQQMLDEQQAVIDKYGDKLGPELISNLQSMGMDAAATWHHMFVTMGQDNADELFEDLGEQFRTGLNLQDTIATEGAKDVTAYQLVLGQLGSEEPDWTKLHDSIQGLDIDADTKAAVQKAADEAKKAGITIPEGLAESIASGETDPQTAIEQLTSATQGAYEGLTQIAEKAGVEVPSSIADGISSGKMSYSDAVQQLASYLSGTDVDWEGEAEKAGNTVSESAATGVEENADEAQNAGSALGDATQAGLASWENSFYNTAVTMGKNVADGLRSKKQSITSAANTAVSGAVSAIQDAAKDMKEAMKFSWNLPKLHGSVPKFAVSMSEAGSGKAKVNIPNIAVGWHYFAEGGILRQPTLIGAIAGEKGDEAVLPLKKLWSEMDKRYAGNNVNCTFYITESGNAEQTAQAVARTLKRELRMA